MCSTWRAVSRSDLLWHRLTRRVWGRTQLIRDTWRDEYVYWHRTVSNFRHQRSSHATLNFDPSDVEDPDGLICRCLTLSDTHLACGFADGAVRLFELATLLHVRTFRPQPREDRFGRFARAITGIVITNHRLIFATLDGDIHVATIVNGPAHPRRAHRGDAVNDGALVDFTGNGRWWVGLYAGVPGRAFHVWDGNTEQLVFVGGSLTDPESVMGWHMLIELAEFVGRVRVTNQETAVACTNQRVFAFDLRNQGVLEDYRRRAIVTSMDVSNSAYVLVGQQGVARVRRVGTLEEVCTFTARGAAHMGAMGCMNRGYALMCIGGVIRVWEVEQHGEHHRRRLYNFRERIGEVNALVASERHVAACGCDTTLHLWDFGAQ